MRKPREILTPQSPDMVKRRQLLVAIEVTGENVIVYKNGEIRQTFSRPTIWNGYHVKMLRDALLAMVKGMLSSEDFR